jgi:hypothetical protein
MTVYGEGEVGDRVKVLAHAESMGVPVAETLTISWAGLAIDEISSIGLDEEEKVQGWQYEYAMRAEWNELRNPLPESLRTAVLDWIEDKGVSQVCVSLESLDAFGTALVKGHAGILRAVGEARAAACFNYALNGRKDTLYLTSVQSGFEIVSELPNQEYVEQVKTLGVKFTYWLEADSALIMGSSQRVSIKEPLTELIDTSIDNDLLNRVLFGRLFNRILLPEQFLQWVPVLVDKSDSGVFLEEATVRYGDLPVLFLERARLKPSQSVEAETPIKAEEKSDRLVVRQVFGQPGVSGQALGRIVASDGDFEGAVYLCDELSLADLDKVGKLSAIIEKSGCGFSLGALIAYKQEIPHVYQVVESDLLPIGEIVEVNGSLGIITVTSQS